MVKIPEKRRVQALAILKNLLCCLRSIHADIFYVALAERGFTEEERMKLVGSCFRTAASKGWMVRTPACLQSRRNHSNLQSVWLSRLFPSFAKSGKDSEGKILAAYAHWQGNKMPPPDELARQWESLSERQE